MFVMRRVFLLMKFIQVGTNGMISGACLYFLSPLDMCACQGLFRLYISVYLDKKVNLKVLEKVSGFCLSFAWDDITCQCHECPAAVKVQLLLRYMPTAAARRAASQVWKSLSL
jgi:hypothetical protein